ncbi:hypothetical protein ACO0LO_06505 [Undibacterium sp. TJN25]|uniref:hypothetical protein n=1 Tax=Undibacterium sp. TJN25 TaxID=3413056 RepID=UPI003BF3BC24
MHHILIQGTAGASRMLVTCAFLVLPGLVYADGLSDLKAALVRQQGQAPLKASIELKTWSRHGEGKDLDETNGLASIGIEDNARGMQVLYSRDVLNRMEAEEKAGEKDQKAKTPVLTALRELNSSELRGMTNAAGALLLSLEKLNFKSERAETWNGKPARLLNFDASLEKQRDKDKKYVKKLEGTTEIWIAADGTPLASRSRLAISGRALIVISFEMLNNEDHVYSLVGDRLIVLRKEMYNKGSGAGEKGETRIIKTLQLQS